MSLLEICYEDLLVGLLKEKLRAKLKGKGWSDMGEAIAVQSIIEENSQPAHEAPFAYQLLDGSVEYAHSIEDAMARCPVLGSMSMEQANVLLELAQVGNEALLATEMITDKELAQDTPPKEPLFTLKQTEPKAPSDISVASEIPQIFLSPDQTERTHIEPAQVVRATPRVEEAAIFESTQNQDRMDTVVNITTDVLYQLEQETLDDAEGVSSGIEVTTSVVKKQAPEVYAVAGNPVEDRPLIPDEAESSAIADQAKVEVRGQAKTASTVEKSTLLVPETREIPSSVMITEGDDVLPETIVTEDTEAGNKPSSSEVMEAYDQLLAVWAEEAKPDRDPWMLATGEDSEVSSLDTVTDQENSGASFEVFSPLPLYTTLEMKEIREHADDRPAEVTLLQVATLLTLENRNLHDDNKDTSEVRKIIAGLREVILQGENKTYHLTPKTIEQSLRLLRAIGYEESVEAFVQCVSTYGFTFLWQTIEHVLKAEQDIELGVFSKAVYGSVPHVGLRSQLVKFLGSLVWTLSY